MKMNFKEKRGSTLLYVLIIIVLLVMVVAVTLVATSNANRQSAFGKEYEQTYYSAESAAQFVAEKVAVKIDKMYHGSSDFYKVVDVKPAVGDRADFDNGIEALLESIETDLKADWVGKEFDGIVITEDMISVDFFPESEMYSDPDSEVWVMYTSAITYIVKIDGGRVVELEYQVIGTVRIEADTLVTSGILEGAETNGYVSTTSNNVYLPLIGDVINNARIAASCIYNVLPPDMDRKALSPLSKPTSANITAASPYAYANGNVVLEGNIDNKDLKYLYVVGNLTLNAGTFNFPNLANVYVTGNLIINSGANLYGNPEKTYPEDGIDMRGNIIGSNFYVKGTLTSSNINALNIYSCRFYASGAVSFAFKLDGFLKGNSVFVSYNSTLELTAGGNDRYHVGDTIYAPQFYSSGILNVRANNPLSRLHGVFGSVNRINVNGDPTNFLVGSIITNGAQGSLVQGMATPIPETSLDNLMDIKYGAKKNITEVQVKHNLTGGGIKSIIENS
ncbi:MAG: hypothetical protein FWE68_05995 [Defluviitaleaceae bacterium]|nr:hypothetical protein [Defluviitaleaceae bacterium]